MIGVYLSLLDTAEEKSKFEELYYEYRNVLYNYAYKILKDTYLAEDAVHNAFLSITKNLNKINTMSCNETRSYLIIIVRNAAYAIYNKNKNVCDNIDNNDDVAAIDNVESIAETNEIRYKIFRIIKSLDSIYSDVLILKLFYEMSDIEIADKLDISVENARVRIFRGRNQLKKLLKEENLYDGQ